ncbi:Cytochrome P450 78A4 [Nymphaea thermarum]|nr:Cytochrome P450 78A4 [Nymphaea thermarum]
MYSDSNSSLNSTIFVTVSLWVVKLAHHFSWEKAPGKEVDLTEVLKLSSEMKNPLCAVAAIAF